MEVHPPKDRLLRAHVCQSCIIRPVDALAQLRVGINDAHFVALLGQFCGCVQSMCRFTHATLHTTLRQDLLPVFANLGLFDLCVLRQLRQFEPGLYKAPESQAKDMRAKWRSHSP